MEPRGMRCEEARGLLPKYVGEGEPYPHELEVHLATCRGCAREEGRYRRVLSMVESLRDVTEPPPAGLAESVMMLLSRRDVVWRGRVRRVAYDPRARYAAVSLGGAMVGAAALALLRWRQGRRAIPRVA